MIITALTVIGFNAATFLTQVLAFFDGRDIDFQWDVLR